MFLSFRQKRRFITNIRAAIKQGKVLDDYSDLSDEVKASIRALSATTDQINSDYAKALKAVSERKESKSRYALES